MHLSLFSLKNFTIQISLSNFDTKNRDKAEEKLLKQNSWIEESGFDISQARCIQVLTESIRKDIMRVVDYLWKDEVRHWEEQDTYKDRKMHIFNVLRRLSKI